MSRRLVKPRVVADRHGVSERTIRNYIGQGYFPAYRVRGARGILVDLDEVEHAMRMLPARSARASKQAYGPKARIVILAPQPVVIDPVPGANQ